MKKNILSYCIIWALVVAWFWVMYLKVNPMDYSIFVFYLILPVTTVICSAKMSISYCSFIEAVIGILVMGLGYDLCYYVTFSLANMIAMDRINRFSFKGSLPEMLIPIIGLLLGLIIRYRKQTTK